MTCDVRHNNSNFLRILSFPSIELTKDSGISSTALCESHPNPLFACSDVDEEDKDDRRENDRSGDGIRNA